MDNTHSHTDSLQKTYVDYLKSKKLSNTAVRNTIFTTICQTKDLFTLEMIGQQLEDKKFHVSRASIYNTMELLLDAKIVVRHQINGINVQYELKYLAEQYNHAICTHCGTVHKIKHNKINSLFTNYKIPKFTIEQYALNFYGICSKCKYRQIQKTHKQIKNKKQN